MELRFAGKNEVEKLKTLWNMCFPDDHAFAGYFFDRLYCPGDTLVYEDQGSLISMLYMLPCRLKMGDVQLRGGYIMSLGTHPRRRHEGLAGKLMEQALFEMHLRGIPLAMLIPKGPALFDYYARMGFEPVFRSERSYYLGLPEHGRPARAGDIPAMDALYERKMRGRAHLLRSGDDWAGILEETRLSGGQTKVLYQGDRLLAYAVLPGGQAGSETVGINESYRRAVSGGGRPYGPASPGRGRAFACARAVNVDRCLDALPVWRPKIRITDPLCPWNEKTLPGAAGTAGMTQNEFVKYLFDSACEKPAYLNLIHN